MATKKQISTLLHELLALYLRITSVLLHKRINAHPENRQVEHNHSIFALLYERIHERVVSSISDANDSEDSNQEIDDGKVEPVGHSTGKHHGKIYRSWAGLSKHFRKKQSEAVFEPYLNERLSKTVWDPIHATLRFSRLGEMEHAKLHADITNNALKEAARYMPSQKHDEFTQEIEEHLMKIREQGL